MSQKSTYFLAVEAYPVGNSPGFLSLFLFLVSSPIASSSLSSPLPLPPPSPSPSPSPFIPAPTLTVSLVAPSVVPSITFGPAPGPVPVPVNGEMSDGPLLRSFAFAFACTCAFAPDARLEAFEASRTPSTPNGLGLSRSGAVAHEPATEIEPPDHARAGSLKKDGMEEEEEKEEEEDKSRAAMVPRALAGWLVGGWAEAKPSQARTRTSLWSRVKGSRVNDRRGILW
ncbi:MAG: hypothetical protein M1819_005224 [Sarea resinae]|nr:MAG: hypothetical protein M1819_005224 [Sarea resinae]